MITGTFGRSAHIFGSISRPLMPGMLRSKRIRLSEASAMTLTRSFDLRLRYRFSPQDHRIQFETWNRVFFGELSRFLLPEFKDSIKFTVHPTRTTCRADLVEKGVGMYRQMIAHEQSNARVATNAQTSGWHLWTVIIPRRSISGKLVSGQVWRRRHGGKWAYKKFVEYADRDITGSGARREAPIR